MPRWLNCYIDERAIENNGQWGLYVCERCGKTFWARMCSKKKTKHVFCSTKCKKDSQVNFSIKKIDNNVFKKIYYKNINLVKFCAFSLLEKNNMCFFDDCLQIGFLELWKTYNRNKMKCSQKYLQKAIRHAMLDNLKYWLQQEKKTISLSNFCKNEEKTEDYFVFYDNSIYDYKAYLQRIEKESSKDLNILLDNKSEKRKKRSIRYYLRKNNKDIVDFLQDV